MACSWCGRVEHGSLLGLKWPRAHMVSALCPLTRRAAPLLFPPAIFEAVGASPDALYSAPEAFEVAQAYVRAAKLEEGAPDNRTLLLDAALCDGLFKGLVKKGETFPTTLPKVGVGVGWARPCTVGADACSEPCARTSMHPSTQYLAWYPLVLSAGCTAGKVHRPHAAAGEPYRGPWPRTAPHVAAKLRQACSAGPTRNCTRRRAPARPLRDAPPMHACLQHTAVPSAAGTAAGGAQGRPVARPRQHGEAPGQQARHQGGLPWMVWRGPLQECGAWDRRLHVNCGWSQFCLALACLRLHHVVSTHVLTPICRPGHSFTAQGTPVCPQACPPPTHPGHPQVTGLEAYLVDVEACAAELRSKLACSTTVVELPGKNNPGHEVVCQGAMIDKVGAAVLGWVRGWRAAGVPTLGRGPQLCRIAGSRTHCEAHGCRACWDTRLRTPTRTHPHTYTSAHMGRRRAAEACALLPTNTRAAGGGPPDFVLRDTQEGHPHKGCVSGYTGLTPCLLSCRPVVWWRPSSKAELRVNTLLFLLCMPSDFSWLTPDPCSGRGRTLAWMLQEYRRLGRHAQQTRCLRLAHGGSEPVCQASFADWN